MYTVFQAKTRFLKKNKNNKTATPFILHAYSLKYVFIVFSKVSSALVVAVEECEQKTKLVTSDIPEVSEENIPPPRRGRCTWTYNVIWLNDQ